MLKTQYTKIKKTESLTTHWVRISLGPTDFNAHNYYSGAFALVKFLHDNWNYSFCGSFPCEKIAIFFDGEGWVADLEADEKTKRFSDAPEST